MRGSHPAALTPFQEFRFIAHADPFNLCVSRNALEILIREPLNCRLFSLAHPRNLDLHKENFIAA